MEKLIRILRDKGGYLCDDSPESFMVRAIHDNNVTIVDGIVVKGIGQGYGRLMGLITEPTIARIGPFGIFRRKIMPGTWGTPVGWARKDTYSHYDRGDKYVFATRRKTWVIKRGHDGRERITKDEELIRKAAELKKGRVTSNTNLG